jgi:hypothetical protein
MLHKGRLALGATAMLVCAAAQRVQGQSVLAMQGNIFLRERNGTVQQLTSSGHDSDPSLSSDGATAVFVRVLRDRPDASGLGRVVDQSEIACIDLANQTHGVRVLLGAPVEARGLRFQWFSSPRFALDGLSVYFLVPDYSTVSPGLFSVELKSGRTRCLAVAHKFWEVGTGQFKGDLIVWQRPMFIGGGRYDIFNMITASGDLVGVVGFDGAKVNAFLSEQDYARDRR